MKRVCLFLLVMVLLSPMHVLACSKGCVGGECGECTGKKPAPAGGYETDPKSLSSAAITTSSLAALIKAKVPMVLLDCRSGGCLDGKVVPGAQYLSEKATDADIAKLIPQKDQLIITYDGNPACCARAEVTARLTALGYSNLIDYPPGIRGWVTAGHEPQTIPVPAGSAPEEK